MPKLIVTVEHVLEENNPELTDSIGELLRNFEASGTVLDFRFEKHEWFVGRCDATDEPRTFATEEDAVKHLTEIALDDPKGVERGDYYIDGPERATNA